METAEGTLSQDQVETVISKFEAIIEGRGRITEVKMAISYRVNKIQPKQ